MTPNAATSGKAPARFKLGLYTAEIEKFADVTPIQFALVSPRLGQSKHRAGVAQLVERKALNLVVKGSSPFFGGHCSFCVCFMLLDETWCVCV